MISTIASKVARRLCNAQIIDANESELYRYGFFVLFSHIFFLVVTFSFSIVSSVVWESILFYILFTLLRSYAGGVHARTEKTCTILTALTMVVCVIAIRLFEAFSMEALALFLLAAGVVFVFVLSPLDSAEKPLEPDERKHYKKITEVITILYVLTALFACHTKYRGILFSVSLSVFLEGVLLIIGKLLSVRHKISAASEREA